MKKIHILTISLLMCLPVQAKAQVEPDYDPSKPPVTAPWFGNVGAAERKADLDFIKGMRPHHAGALTMSQEYLKNKNASDPRLQKLAKGIMHNQTFEIGLLDMLEGFAKPAAPAEGTEWRQIAVKGLAQKQKFVRAPVPVLWGGGPVSKEDVRFAKAMIVHHEGALTMCKDYLGNDDAQNKYLRLLCVDILKDQANDIRFMRSVIGYYPGNPDEVTIDASMIHGMEGMDHGAHGSRHKAAPAKVKAVPKAPTQPAAHSEHHH